MELVNFVKCSKYRTVKGCCGKEMGADSENEGNEYNIEEFVFAGWKSKLENVQPVINLELIENGQKDCYEDTSSIPFLWPSSTKNSVYLPCSESSCETKEQTSAEYMQEETFSSLRAGQEKDFLCPRCGKRMQEPRLLPCLHAICSPCVVELMNKSGDGTSEMCPLCDFRLPNSSSPVPPPHYPLQHRLIMDAIRCQLANRVLCDACSDEVLAVVQCSACLRNFCNDCGMEHQQQITMELKPSKHSVRPLWEATKVRRTALCQKHPSHALRFYCIACQQVTCKECMWSIQHRGHASENAIGAGRRAALYLTMLLQKAKALLNHLLSQYNRDAFAESPLDDLQDQIMDYRYVELLFSIL